ncbi:hypothetical protein E1I37_09715 [Campylobacter coli]|nr:hypothetical protein [Campylobacter coli]
MDNLKQLSATCMQIFIKLNGMHYLAKGNQFHRLHEITQEHYEFFQESFDTFNERLVQLNLTPCVNIQEIHDLKNPYILDLQATKLSLDTIVTTLINDFKLVDNSVAVIIQEAIKIEDTVTEDILRTFRIRLQKYIWMLESMQS